MDHPNFEFDRLLETPIDQMVSLQTIEDRKCFDFENFAKSYFQNTEDSDYFSGQSTHQNRESLGFNSYEDFSLNQNDLNSQTYGASNNYQGLSDNDQSQQRHQQIDVSSENNFNHQNESSHSGCTTIQNYTVDNNFNQDQQMYQTQADIFNNAQAQTGLIDQLEDDVDEIYQQDMNIEEGYNSSQNVQQFTHLASEESTDLAQDNGSSSLNTSETSNVESQLSMNHQSQQFNQDEDSQEEVFDEKLTRTCKECQETLASKGAFKNHLKIRHGIEGKFITMFYSIQKPRATGRPKKVNNQRAVGVNRKIERTEKHYKPQYTCRLCDNKSYKDHSGFYNHVMKKHHEILPPGEKVSFYAVCPPNRIGRPKKNLSSDNSYSS